MVDVYMVRAHMLQIVTVTIPITCSLQNIPCEDNDIL